MTTTTTTLVPAHLVRVVSDGYEYLAECSCGWASDFQATSESADTAGTDHTENAVGPPDDLDQAITELLDLQDDLAATVVWLAENWSADLPAPYVHTTTHYSDNGPPGQAGVRLLVPCGDDDELTRAAARLEAQLIDDQANDKGRERYRRATRIIGRAHVQAYANLDRCQPPEAWP
jgi:hypothetical protein